VSVGLVLPGDEGRFAVSSVSSATCHALSVVDRARCVEVVLRSLTKLKDVYDIRVTFDAVADDDGAEWDPLRRTLTINHHLDIDDMAFVCCDFFSFLTIGPHGSIARQLPGGTLYVVPDLDTPHDQATA
jgi:hypothetical protein